MTIMTYEILKNKLTKYKAPDNKIKRVTNEGDIIKITKNLYETKKDIPGYLVANAIYSPSYLSFDYALAFYGLIPEAVYVYTSATFKKNRTKEYINSIGTFSYRDVPYYVYPYGIKIIKENEYFYAIATPEKAVCDKLYTLKPVKNKAEMLELLINDLRIDLDTFKTLNLDELNKLCEIYKSTNMKILRKVAGDLIANNS